jgi:hypothetical protein
MQYAPNTATQYIEDALDTIKFYKGLNGMIECCYKILEERYDAYLRGRFNHYQYSYGN